MQLSLVSGAWDLRNFNTTQSRCYRFLDTLANVGSSVVPIVNNNNYRDVASIFAGVADPSIKKYFGDMTDSQQQIFLRESMPELLELKVGEEASKLVYFSRIRGRQERRGSGAVHHGSWVPHTNSASRRQSL